MDMPFGKHKGTPLEDCPPDYLRWLMDKTELREPLRTEVQRVLGKPTELDELRADVVRLTVQNRQLREQLARRVDSDCVLPDYITKELWD